MVAVRSRPYLGLALLLAVLVALYGSLGLGLQDDTFISLRYARNLVEGHGLVFNPGEPVEGYTNFLWTLLLAVVIRLGLNTLPMVVLLGTASAMALVMASRRLGPVGWVGWVCPVLLVGSAPLALESVQGLETVFFAALLGWGLVGLQRELAHPEAFPWSSLAFGLAALTRPEGVLFYGVAQLSLVLVYRQLGPGRQKVGWAVVGAVICAHLLFRYNFYGTILPNTFYVKVGGGLEAWIRGAGYISKFAINYPVLVVLAGLGVWRAGRTLRHEDRQTWGMARGFWVVILAWCAVHVVYVAYVGGDFKPSFRFLVPLLLPLSLLAALGSSWLQTRFRSAGILVCLLIVAEWAGGWSRARTEAEYRARDMEERLMVGVWLGEHLPAGSLVALHSVGAIPWASRLPTVDLWGLTDAHIARVEVEAMGTGMVGHEKTDYPYAFGRNPVVYLPEEGLVTVEPTRLPVPSDFPANFEERYEQLSVRLGERWLNLFRLRDTSFEGATR